MCQAQKKRKKENGRKKSNCNTSLGTFYKLHADVPLINIQRLLVKFCEDEEWITCCSISAPSLEVLGSRLECWTQGNS